MPITVRFTSGGDKVVKQAVPESWKSKPVSALVERVASSVLGQKVETDQLALFTDSGQSVDLSDAIVNAMSDGATFIIKLAAAAGDDQEPPPKVSTEVEYAAIKTSLKGGDEATKVTATVTTPSGAIEPARIEKDGAASTIHYTPSSEGKHQLEISLGGMSMGGKPFNSSPVGERPRAWGQCTADEQAAVLAWFSRRLAAAGLATVVAVAIQMRSAELIDVGCFPADSSGGSGGDTEIPADCAHESSLRVLGIIDERQMPKWKPLLADLQTVVPACEVFVVQGGREDVQDAVSIRAMLMHNYSRSHSLASHRLPLDEETLLQLDAVTSQGNGTGSITGQTTVTLSERADKLILALRDAGIALEEKGTAVEDGDATGTSALVSDPDDEDGPVIEDITDLSIGAGSKGVEDALASPLSNIAHLDVLAFVERWAHAANAAEGAEVVAGVQIEGFAAQEQRAAIIAAVDTIDSAGIMWYGSKEQGLLHARRRAKNGVDEHPIVRLRKDKYLRTRQRVVTRELQRNWIESAEAFCLSRVPCGLGGLLRQAAVSLDGEPTHKWKAGKKRLSKLPPVDFYPHFLSEKEVEQFLYLGLLHSIPSHGAMGEGKGALVQFSKHYSDLIGLSRLVETRCAEATGVPVHEHEAPVMMQHTLESASGPFVSSLESGITHEKRFRCATVVLFLNDVPEGKGGETRFPLAEISEGHPLIDIGKRAVHQGFSTIDPGAKDAPKEWGTLVDVANGHDLGVHIRPQRGAACVYWTMDEDGGIDARAFHGSARVADGGGGRWVVVKHKELNAAARAVRPLTLPEALRKKRGA